MRSLTHWGRVTHICVGKLTIIGSDNGLSPGRRQAIIWTNAGILLIGPPGTKFNEILIGIHTFSFKEMHLKMSSGKWWPFCLGLNVLNISALRHGRREGRRHNACGGLIDSRHLRIQHMVSVHYICTTDFFLKVWNNYSAKCFFLQHF